MRTAAINLRAHSQQRALIDQASAYLGRNRSDFMLEAACEKAQSVLMDQAFFCLGKPQFDAVMAMLDAPVQPNPGLEQLLQVASPWDATAKAPAVESPRKTSATR